MKPFLPKVREFISLLSFKWDTTFLASLLALSMLAADILVVIATFAIDRYVLGAFAFLGVTLILSLCVYVIVLEIRDNKRM